MHPLAIILSIALFTTANLLTSYLYLFPIANRCAFPEPAPSAAAPFRLLVFGDPQLEGSSSLVNTEYTYFPSIHDLRRDFTTSTISFSDIVSHAGNLVSIDVPILFKIWRKRLDLFGNDFYLAHIYRSLRWFTLPTHTAVLGDLIGSQWISNSEFDERGRRYWGRVFAGAQKVEDEITAHLTSSELGKDERWAKWVINVAGNHDIGYAGDITKARLARFERIFGRVNWETRFTMPVGPAWNKSIPKLRLVVLNSLNIDGPVEDRELQSSTFEFLDHLVDTRPPLDDSSSATILLTHLPLHKEAGVCVDYPLIKYYPLDKSGAVEEQNHLSNTASAGILNTIYGLGQDSRDSDFVPGHLGRQGLVLTGHDHEGCDVYHYLPKTNDSLEWGDWQAEKWTSSSQAKHSGVPGIREITLRSMMGDFGGNAGLLSAWFDDDKSRWEFAFATCPLGKQHFWWAVHIFDFLTVLLCSLVGLSVTRGNIASQPCLKEGKQKTQ